MNIIEAFENASKSMDITNSSQREIVCTDNADHTWGGYDHASQFLNFGAIYHIDHIEVHSCHTRVFLKEYPDRWFNSVAFAEMEQTDECF